MKATTTEQIKATDATITDEQADALAAFLSRDADLWTTTEMPIIRTSDAERSGLKADGTYQKLNTKSTFA
jgi:hypothetical protein